MDLRSKVVLVTGASKGIGQATAIEFAKAGSTVIVHYNTDQSGAQATLAECAKHSPGHIIIQADVTSEPDIQHLVSAIRSKFSHIDVLVNNAGIFDGHDNPENIQVFDLIYRTNLRSLIMVTQHLKPLMPAGKIINVSSIHGRLGHGRPEAIAYSAFKAALESYTKNLAKDYAPAVLVNAIAPGRVVTPQWGDLDEAAKQELGQAHLIQRMIVPPEVADAIVFLARNDAVCGEVLTIDGGMSLVTLG